MMLSEWPDEMLQYFVLGVFVTILIMKVQRTFPKKGISTDPYESLAQCTIPDSKSAAMIPRTVMQHRF